MTSWAPSQSAPHATFSPARDPGPVQSANEGPGSTPPKQANRRRRRRRLKDVEETSIGNLGTWDALIYHGRKLCKSFPNWNSQRNLKSIPASPEVLRTYHDSFLFGKVPWRMRAKAKLRILMRSFVWQSMEFAFALVSGILYVYYTYKPDNNNFVSRAQDAISAVFLADFIIRVYCEPIRLQFIFSFWGVLDLLSVIPIIIAFRTTVKGASLIRLLQFVRVVRIFSLAEKIRFLFGTSVMYQVLLLTTGTFIVILLDAGLMQWIEYHAVSASTRATCPAQGCVTFWKAFYFIIVTISTVGYGDVTLETIPGQVVAIITIIAAFTILPIQIGRIVSLVYRRPYGGSFSARKVVGARYFIISGSITFAAVQGFLAEVYNPTHCDDLEAYPLRVVILAPFSPPFELKQLIGLYNGLVEFIEGAPVRQSDLKRISADTATAFIFLANMKAEDAEIEDAAQIVRALAVDRFCYARSSRQEVRIILEVLDPDTQASAVWGEFCKADIEVICPVKVHYKMMARSCTIRGLYTLITNLFTSELKLKHMNAKHFLSEYCHSFDNEVYPVVLPRAFHNLSFEAVAEFVFVNYNSTLFAVDSVVGYQSNGKAERKLLLFPKGRPINSDDVGIIIATSLSTAYAISMYQSEEEGPGLLHRIWVHGRENYGIELLDRSCGNWKRSEISEFNATRGGAVGMRSAAPGEHGPGSNVRSPEGSLTLDNEVVSASEGVYSVQEDPRLGNPTTGHERGISQGRDIEVPGSGLKTIGSTDKHETGSGHGFEGGMSLEKAEDFLAWPPLRCGDRPRPSVVEHQQDVILKHLKERTITMVKFIEPHILVCSQTGFSAHFFYFMVEIRSRGSPNLPVVILHPNDLTARQWGAVGVFEDVYFVKGSPLCELDLQRGGVLQADKIVILCNDGTTVDLQGSGEDEDLKQRVDGIAYTSDVHNVVIAANIQRLYGQKRLENIIVEMQQTEGFFYLRPQYDISGFHFPHTAAFKRNQDAMVHFGAPFMEGKAVSSSMLRFLMRSSLYNRNTHSIVDQLIGGGDGHTEAQEGPRTLSAKSLDQIAVPEEYSGRPYRELFLGLLREKAVLAIGLYRACGTLGSPTGYVHTNPLQDCRVGSNDLVYILR